MANPKVVGSVNAAQLALSAAREALRVANDEASAKAAGRSIYQALASVCRAYLAQFVDESGRPRVGAPQQAFPPEAALMFRSMVEGWLVGRTDQSLTDLLSVSGAPGRSLIEAKDIEDACRYMQAADGPTALIEDLAPVKRVGGWYGVSRATAQSWKRDERRDLVASFLADAATAERISVITNRAKKAGERYSRHGRGQRALGMRSAKRRQPVRQPS